MNITRGLGITLLTASLLLSVSSAYAGGGRKEGKGVMLVERMQKELSLTDEQANKVFNIVRASKKESPCRDLEVFTEIKKCKLERHKKIDDNIASILNKEQSEKFQQLRAEREKNGWGHGRGEGRGCPECPCKK